VIAALQARRVGWRFNPLVRNTARAEDCDMPANSSTRCRLRGPVDHEAADALELVVVGDRAGADDAPDFHRDRVDRHGTSGPVDEVFALHWRTGLSCCAWTAGSK
jgi:hypothetical protein